MVIWDLNCQHLSVVWPDYSGMRCYRLTVKLNCTILPDRETFQTTDMNTKPMVSDVGGKLTCYAKVVWWFFNIMPAQYSANHIIENIHMIQKRIIHQNSCLTSNQQKGKFHFWLDILILTVINSLEWSYAIRCVKKLNVQWIEMRLLFSWD